MSLLHFILIYDHQQQRLLDALEFGDRREDATAKYAEIEREYKDREGLEIVLVGADSLDTIRKTHAHYFSDEATEPFGELLTGA
jgi:hypothetical protein